jgi:hypothetical protein
MDAECLVNPPLSELGLLRFKSRESHTGRLWGLWGQASSVVGFSVRLYALYEVIQRR